MTQIECWDIYELTLKGPQTGNPFADVNLYGNFKHNHREIKIEGFYDGAGYYRIRFMPDTPGHWSFHTISNITNLDGIRGEFECMAPAPGNHGPVHVSDTYHFAYADGNPYFPLGTTCYAWNHQEPTLQEETLATLKESPFNKIRMCVFPKHYAFNCNEPQYHPFEKNENGGRDFTRFNPLFFRHLETQIGKLAHMGIEADLILFHPYDRWGYSSMGKEINTIYIRYLAARISSYRNLWWSLANEHDLMETIPPGDWDYYFRLIQDSDPYQHLRSIHNCTRFYDHGKLWVTHCSIQSGELSKTVDWRKTYVKPVIIDECGYEGNTEFNWGSLTPREMVNRIWQGIARGGYVGHGETYLHPEDVLWWSKGGSLHGESLPRISFLRRILEEGPARGLNPVCEHWNITCAGEEGGYYLHYFGNNQPARRFIDLPEDSTYLVEIIDTWEMSVTSLGEGFSGHCEIPLPGKPQIAIRARRNP